MVVIRNYEEGDVFRVKIRSGDPLGGPVKDQPGPAWTLENGEILACMGIVPAGGGVGNLWMFTSDEARGHGLRMAKFGRQRLLEAFASGCYHRIQCVVRTDKEEYSRWAELFGFECEGRLRKATPSGDDLFMYARVED